MLEETKERYEMKIDAKLIEKEISFDGKSSKILSNVNLKIDEGEFVGIIGNSGSGKTTLLGILSGLDKPTNGTVVINDNNIYSMSDNKLSEFRNDNIGIIFQNFNLIPTLNVYENIFLPLLYSQNKHTHSSAKLNIAKLLKTVDLDGVEKKYPNQLSGGEQQRVAIARAIVNDPQIIFADEPTGALDESNSISVIKLLKELNEVHNVTVVMVTHNLELIKYFSRVIRLKDGEIV